MWSYASSFCHTKMKGHRTLILTRYVFFTDPSTPIQKCKVTCNLSNFKTKYFFTLTQVGFQIGIFTFTKVDFEGGNFTFT